MTARRVVLRALGLAALTASVARANGQQPTKTARVGVLWIVSSSDTLPRRRSALFRQRLRELGYVEGKTIVIDERFAEGNPQRLKELARELVDAKMDVIVTPTVTTTIAVRQATDTIPIVMVHAGNPIGAGLIASLARPGGNVTGTANLPLGGKQVDLMREVMPRMTRLTILDQHHQRGSAVVRREHDRGCEQVAHRGHDRRGQSAGGLCPSICVDPQRAR